jgi:hypothetical protein
MVKLMDKILESKFSHRLAKWLEDVGEVLYALRERHPTNSRGASGIFDPHELFRYGKTKSPIAHTRQFGTLLRFEEYERKQIIEEDYSI